MALLNSPHAKKLLAQSRCPACGAARAELIDERLIIIAGYECSAKFMVQGDREILAHSICPAASHIAAWTLNAEVIAETDALAGAA